MTGVHSFSLKWYEKVLIQGLLLSQLFSKNVLSLILSILYFYPSNHVDVSSSNFILWLFQNSCWLQWSKMLKRKYQGQQEEQGKNKEKSKWLPSSASCASSGRITTSSPPLLQREFIKKIPPSLESISLTWVSGSVSTVDYYMPYVSNSRALSWICRGRGIWGRNWEWFSPSLPLDSSWNVCAFDALLEAEMPLDYYCPSKKKKMVLPWDSFLPSCPPGKFFAWFTW